MVIMAMISSLSRPLPVVGADELEVHRGGRAVVLEYRGGAECESGGDTVALGRDGDGVVMCC
jgi:hypothetical protein